MKTIGIHNDHWGRLGWSQAEEYKFMRDYFKDRFKAKFCHLKRIQDAQDHDLAVLVVDYGGLRNQGCDGLLSSNERWLKTYAEEHPNTLVIFWSQFSLPNVMWYILENESPAILLNHNVIVWEHFKDQEEQIKLFSSYLGK